MYPHGLGVHQGKVAAAFGVGFVSQEELCPSGNDGQRIVDLVARPGGKLGHRRDLLGLDRLAKRSFQER